jgi:hypothetical protein
MNSVRSTSHVFAILAFISGCGAATGQVMRVDLSPTTGFEPPRRERQSDVILPTEIRAIQANTAADAVRQLRPEFLRSTPTNAFSKAPALASVYLNGHYAGPLEVLSTIPVAAIVEIRYVTTSAAKSAFGSYCACDGGVILVRTR